MIFLLAVPLTLSTVHLQSSLSAYGRCSCNNNAHTSTHQNAGCDIKNDINFSPLSSHQYHCTTLSFHNTLLPPHVNQTSLTDSKSMKIIDELEQLIVYTKANKKALGNAFCAEVSKDSTKFMKELSESVRKNILHKLHEKKLSEESLKAIITAIPSALSVQSDETEHIPIQTLACDPDESSIHLEYWPRKASSMTLLGKEIRESCSYGERILISCYILLLTILNLMTMLPLLNIMSNTLCLDILKDLRESSILTVQDIGEHSFLSFATESEVSRQRFEYLSNLDPEALKMTHDDGTPFFHLVGYSKMCLCAALKYFPNELGLLFQWDRKGITTLESFLPVLEAKKR